MCQKPATSEQNSCNWKKWLKLSPNFDWYTGYKVDTCLNTLYNNLLKCTSVMFSIYSTVDNIGLDKRGIWLAFKSLFW